MTEPDSLTVNSPLPRGRHRLSAAQVAAHQRERLFVAMAASLAERGYAATSVEHVISGAKVSRATFYKYFANKRDCLLAAHEAAFDRLVERLRAACSEHVEWADRVRAAVDAALGFLVEDPPRAHLLTLSTLAADPVVARRVVASNGRLAALLREGRELHPAAAPPSIAERALVHAVAGALFEALLDGDPVDELAPQLTTLLLTPYLGVAPAFA